LLGGIPTRNTWLWLEEWNFFFKGFTVEYIGRNKNSKADELAKATARNTPLPANVFYQTITDTSIKQIEPEPQVINII
jgi:hypothetical protein